MAKQKLENIAPFGLRLQPDLKSKLETAAHKVPRSLNAEITARLEESLRRRGLKDFTTGEIIDELIRRLGSENVEVSLRVTKPQE